MMKVVILATLLATAIAAPSHHGHFGHLAAPAHGHLAAPLVAAAPVVAHAPVVAAAPAVTAVHHPPTVNTHLAPAAIVAQTPTLSGYSYTSEVRHDVVRPVVAAAPVVHAPAPIVAAAPVVHAAPAVAAPVVHAAAPVAVPAAPVFSKSYAVETGHLVAGHTVHAAPLVHGHHAAPVLAAPAAPLLAAPHYKGKA